MHDTTMKIRTSLKRNRVLIFFYVSV